MWYLTLQILLPQYWEHTHVRNHLGRAGEYTNSFTKHRVRSGFRTADATPPTTLWSKHFFMMASACLFAFVLKAVHISLLQKILFCFLFFCSKLGSLMLTHVPVDLDQYPFCFWTPGRRGGKQGYKWPLGIGGLRLRGILTYQGGLSVSRQISDTPLRIWWTFLVVLRYI